MAQALSLLLSSLSARVIEEFERVVRHDPGRHEEDTQHQNVLKEITSVEETAEKTVHELLDSATAICRATVLRIFARLYARAVGPIFGRKGTDPVTVRRARIGSDEAIITRELRHDQAFENIVARRDVVRSQEEATEILRADDESREEVVDTDKDRVQNLGSRHASDTAHKGLAKVTVQREVESEETPKGLVGMVVVQGKVSHSNSRRGNKKS